MRPLSRGGTGFSNQQAGCHLVGVYSVVQAGHQAGLGAHEATSNGLGVHVRAGSTIHGSYSMLSAPNGTQIFALNLPIQSVPGDKRLSR